MITFFITGVEYELLNLHDYNLVIVIPSFIDSLNLTINQSLSLNISFITYIVCINKYKLTSLLILISSLGVVCFYVGPVIDIKMQYNTFLLLKLSISYLKIVFNIYFNLLLSCVYNSIMVFKTTCYFRDNKIIL